MSVGDLGNRSQPDDFMAHALYTIFNEPMVTMRYLQKAALLVLLAQVAYIFLQRTKTMKPFQILNFMMCTLYVHSYLLQAEDFKAKVQQEKDKARRVQEWFTTREKHRNVPIEEEDIVMK